jgi:hypothetical protein
MWQYFTVPLEGHIDCLIQMFTYIQPHLTYVTFGRHDIAEILLRVALNTKNQSINQCDLPREQWNIVTYGRWLLNTGLIDWLMFNANQVTFQQNWPHIILKNNAWHRIKTINNCSIRCWWKTVEVCKIAKMYIKYVVYSPFLAVSV